jgi:hypothetical protein
MSLPVDFLISAKAQSLLFKYKDERDPFRIRKILSEVCSSEDSLALSQQIIFREHARRKFPEPQKMLFDREGLEQSTHAAVAAFHASLFDSSDTLLEVCSGLGADSIEFSKKVRKLYMVESDAARSAFSRFNCLNLGNHEKCVVIDSLFEDADIPDDLTSLYADPSRRISGKRIIEPDEYSPALTQITDFAKTRKIENGKCIIKLSPLCEYDALLREGRVDVISLDGEVKEVLFFLDNEKAGSVRAVVLGHNNFEPYTVIAIQREEGLSKSIQPIGSYIAEPDNAIIRAGVVNELAHRLHASFLQSQTAYLTLETKGDENGYRAYKVIDAFDFNAKKMKEYLKSKKIEALSVKKRGLRETSEELQKKIGIKRGSNSLFLFLWRIGDTCQGALAERR